jgi:hypothetical protein
MGSSCCLSVYRHKFLTSEAYAITLLTVCLPAFPPNARQDTYEISLLSLCP